MAIIVLTSGESLTIPGQDAQTVMQRLNQVAGNGREQTAEGPVPTGWVPFETDGGRTFVAPHAVAYVREGPSS